MKLRKSCRSLGMGMAVLSFILVLGATVGVQASQINKEPFVDSINLSMSEAFVDQSVDMHVTFSEKDGHKFKPGDQMIFDLPQELEGFANTLQLEDYATVRVENRRATITFNDIVAVKENIRGTMTFSAHVLDKIANNTEKTIDVNLGMNMQSIPKLKGHKTDQNHVDSPASYKGGHVDVNNPYILHWYVVVNPKHLPITGDVLVTDQLSKGHVYKRNSFRIEGGVKNAVTPPVDITRYHGNAEQFQMYLPQDLISGHGVAIHYETIITKSGKKNKELDNTFFTQFRPGYNNPKDVQGGFKLANLLVKGNIIGDDSVIPEEDPLLEATENVQDMPEEETQSLPDVPEEHMSEKDTPQDVGKDVIEGKQPEIHTDQMEEIVPTEPNVQDMPSVNSEKAIEATEKHVLENGMHGDSPKLQMLPTEDAKLQSTTEKFEKTVQQKAVSNKQNLKMIEETLKADSSSLKDSTVTNDTKLPKTDTKNHVLVTVMGILGCMFASMAMVRVVTRK